MKGGMTCLKPLNWMEAVMLKSGAVAACAVASLVAFGGLAATSTSAEAGWRNGHGYAYGHRYAAPRGHYYRPQRGRNVGLGVAAGLLAVGALAAASSHAYAAPAPAYGYEPVYYAPRCVVRHRTVWDPYHGYVSQPVRVCR
jgi:hypothetical protein